eukprot:gene10850-12003_t
MADEEGFQDTEFEKYNPLAIRSNINVVDYSRAFLAVISGSSAGILGLTGLQGFVFYLALSLLMSVLLVFKTGKHWDRFFLSRWSMWGAGIFGELFTYLLVWTFMYGMIHVF